MDMLKTLTTPRLYLNEIIVNDSNKIFGLFSNDDVLGFYDVKKFKTTEQAEELIQRIYQ